GGSLRTYRHTPNTGSRKSWAAGDATSRGVRLSMMAIKGEMGYEQALSAPDWGFQDAIFRKKEISIPQPFGSYVMENVLFKVAYPAEFHAQTALEAAVKLHPQVKDRLDDIDIINIITHESAIRIIDKQGPLYNPADRDHCIQYITAIGLMKGTITAEDYEDTVAKDPTIDQLREKMVLTEDVGYSTDYLNPETRSIANAVQIQFKDGTMKERVEIEYPLGHRVRRKEAIPVLRQKFINNLSTVFAKKQQNDIEQVCFDYKVLPQMPVHNFVDLFVK